VPISSEAAKGRGDVTLVELRFRSNCRSRLTDLVATGGDHLWPAALILPHCGFAISACRR
jgi:hypothetical protein